MSPLDALAKRTGLRRVVIHAIYGALSEDAASQEEAYDRTERVANVIAALAERPLLEPR